MPLTIGTQRALLRGGKSYIDKVLGYGPIAYWPMNEKSGAVARCYVNPAQNGAYTGVTLGQPGIGDGNTAPTFDGANDYVNVLTAAFAAAFSGTEGTVAMWGRVTNAGIWGDATSRYLMQINSVGGNDHIRLWKSAAANTLSWQYAAAGANVNNTLNPVTTTAWFHYAITWSGAANQVAYYYNGASAGAIDAMPGVWAGAVVVAVVGASSLVPGSPHSGWIAQLAVWTRALALAEITDLAVV